MSASQHIVRVVRSGDPVSRHPSPLPAQVRVGLLIALNCGVLYIVLRAAGPELPQIIAALQNQLALSRYWH